MRPAAAATALECRGDRPVGVGDALTFRVRDPEAGSTYQWSGSDGLSATGEVVTWTYGSAGWKLATVSQLDGSGSVVATALCGMHVLPPPGGAASVAPVLWVPADVDPAPLVPQLDRVWRSIRAAFYDHYGHTFVLEPVRSVRSASTEQDICGGDCTDLGLASTLMNRAFNDANPVAPAVPYRRYQFVMAWGAGGWAGSWGWDIAKGGIGDWAIATAAGVLIPQAEPNLPDWAAAMFSTYPGAADGMWHETNHGIGWDEDNSQFIDHPPTQWEQDVVAESPWLTEIPADTTPPSVSIATPLGGATISGTTTVHVNASDSDGMDAVALVVDGQLQSVATSPPYSFNLDTSGLSSDRHELTAIAYDAAGNTAQQTIGVNVMNELGGPCDTNPPVGQFFACMYAGTNFDTYLGTMVDGVDQLDTGATAWGPRHQFLTGTVFHGIGTEISGRWKGVVDLPAGNYLFHVLADDGIRLRINGQLVLDEWRIQADRFTAAASGLSGPTTIEVDWFQNFGGKALELWWQPTTSAPTVTEQPDDQSVPEGAAVTFTTAASGDPSPTVQWQSSTDGGHTFTDVPGANSPTLSLVAHVADNGTQYRAVFTNQPAGQPTTTTLTNPATLTVTTGPAPPAWQTLGGYVTADPAAVVDPANPAGLYVFVRGGDNALYFQHSNDGVNWSGFTRAGGYITSAPYAVADTAGVSGAVGVYVFVRGGDNALYVGRLVGGVWQGFQPLGGALTSFPVATTTSSGLWVGVRGGDAGLYARHLSAGAWSPWQGFGGYLNSAPWLAADLLGVHALVAGGDHGLYERNLSGPLGWVPLGGFVTGQPTAVAKAGATEVFVVGGDGAVYTREFCCGRWTPYQKLGGDVTSVAFPVVGPKGVSLFVRGGDGNLYRNHATGQSWSGWSSVAPSPFESNAIAVADPNSIEHVFVVGADNALHTIGMSAAEGSTPP